MSDMPIKRGSDETVVDEDETHKRQRVSESSEVEAEEDPFTSQVTPDSQIDHKAAIAYWTATEPSINGVLGGFPQVSKVDIQGSSNFFAKLRRSSKHHPTNRKLKRAVDCGAGIGRITVAFLTNIAEKVDVVEPVKPFTDQIERTESLGTIYNIGLEDWHPDKEGLGPYDLIWNQWCVGQLTDAQFVSYLKRLPPVLSEGGWIVVKENVSNHPDAVDVFDEDDSSVTRTDAKFRKLFEQAGLKVVRTEQQKGMPKDLYPVRAYALQPK